MGNPQRSLEDRANWLGGIIDGEGMVTVMHYMSRAGRHNYQPRISIVNTDPIIIDEVLSILTALGIPHYVQTKAGKGTWKTKIEVIIQGVLRCSRVLPVLIPLLVSKKAKAIALLEFCESRLGQGRPGGRLQPYSEKEWGFLERVKTNPKYPLIRSETTRQTPADPLVMI